MGKAIFEIKELNPYSVNADSPLGKWFYDLVQKDICSLTDFDIERMMRQNIYLDIAIPQALKLLKRNPFCGTMYSGQMLGNLIDTLRKNPNELQKNNVRLFLENIQKTIRNYNCDDQQEEAEYGIFIQQIDNLLESTNDPIDNI